MVENDYGVLLNPLPVRLMGSIDDFNQRCTGSGNLA